MTSFLEQLARHLYAVHGENLGQLCLVFPNRRANLFFRQHLSKLIGKPVWMPDMYALEDFVVEQSGLRLSDPLTLLAKLYKVYAGLAGDQAQPFADFIAWGNMLLADFDEIDQYRADGVKVFSYLDEAKALQHWNLDGKPLTAFEQRYLQFYNSLAPCYKAFRETLLTDGEAYFGLAFCKLLDQLNPAAFERWHMVIFAGFNALTPAEEEFIKFMRNAGKAETYWDADTYYLSDSNQEAGHFMRQYLENGTFGKLEWIGSNLSEGTKHISVLGFPGDAGQAKLAGELCSEYIRRNNSAEGLAIVLVDEGLLLPVLNAIPLNAGDFNVTMGFPLRQTPVFSLMNAIVALFAAAERNASHENASWRFYHKDISRLLNHPYIAALRKTGGGGIKPGSEFLPEKPFYAALQLTELLRRSDSRLAALFEKALLQQPPSADAVVHLVSDVITLVYESTSGSTGSEGEARSPDSEYLVHAMHLVSNLGTLLADPALKINTGTLLNVLSGLMASVRLPFYGEPLKGLQVMGMLETRLLDFSSVIMISANEGLLPKGKHQHTFVPDDIRAAFGMQRYNERNAVFAYHFYRLMQRAENAWLVYNSEGDALGGGEKSRFITQLMHEMPGRNSRCTITSQIVAPSSELKPGRDISVPKTEAIMLRLREMAKRGLSPTALAMYLACPLQFYYAHVLRISEPDQVSETIDAALLGEMVHQALHRTYEPFTGRLIMKADYDAMIGHAVKNVDAAFAERFSSDELSSGKNVLILQVARNMVKNLLVAEQKHLGTAGVTLEVLMLEQPLERSIEAVLHDTGELLTVKLHGKADRIDRAGEVLRVIDYKTGKLEAKELKCGNLAELADMENPAKLFQVLAYAYMLAGLPGHSHLRVESGIISLRAPSDYFQKAVIGSDGFIDERVLSDFEAVLREIIESIYDSAEPFSPTDDFAICGMCSFAAICNRISG